MSVTNPFSSSRRSLWSSMMVVSSTIASSNNGNSGSATRRNVHGNDKKEKDLHHKDSNGIDALVVGDEEEGGAKYDKGRRRRRLLNRNGKHRKSSHLLVSILCLCVGSLLGGLVLVGTWATYSWVTSNLLGADPAYAAAMHKFEAAKRQLHQHRQRGEQMMHGHHNGNIKHHHHHHHNNPFANADDNGGSDAANLSPAVAHLTSTPPSGLDSMTESELAQLFDTLRPKDTSVPLHPADEAILHSILKAWHARLDEILQQNNNHQGSDGQEGPRWIRPYLLPPLKLGQHELTPTPDRDPDPQTFSTVNHREQKQQQQNQKGQADIMLWKWEQEWHTLQAEHTADADPSSTSWQQPPVDYTKPDKYVYPPLLSEPPATGGYPTMLPLKHLLDQWPQTKDNPDTIHETLLHFNYSHPDERAMAERFRNARLPFKLYDIPEISEVTKKWTDDYVQEQFDAEADSAKNLNPFRHHDVSSDKPMPADGVCQESPDHFFAFYVPPLWQSAVFGPTPVRHNEWTFAQWAQHARYADATALDSDKPHFYWQAGVPKQERFQKPHQQSFISRDLNATLGATEDNFFVFNIAEQKGIQCRFGERGVTAATHYDGGQNMIAMLTGAKRYILSPPMACPDLGVFNSRESPIFRHSLLNFAHLEYLEKKGQQENGMSAEERAWLTRAARAPAVETVLKEGEVLFLPSFWFHYIVSVQKSAQCNVRSGIDQVGTTEFGSVKDINECGLAGSDPREDHGRHVKNF